jgi:prefoldin subunit 5
MKRIMLFAAMVAILFACKEAEKKEIENLKQQITALRDESFAKDSAINEFFKMLNEIEMNLTIIKEKERIISKSASAGRELAPDARERINSDIDLINELMNKNRQTILHLNNQVKGANFKVDEFEKRLQQTASMLEIRDQEIEALKERLTKLHFSVEALNATLDTLNRAKEELIEEVHKQTQLLNTAWYVFGTKKELIENKIVEKVGGFLGLGKTIKIKDDFNAVYFSRIDITTTHTIELFAKKPNLVSTHPSSSYRFVENASGIAERLEIIEPNEFWSTTKYLVIEVH